MIAICTMAWNGLEHSRRFLNSVRESSVGLDCQLFLLDNGSTDTTSRLFQSYGPLWSARNETNEGIYKGWNKLLQAAYDANADIICLSNNDVIVESGWLHPVLREFARDRKRYLLPNGNPQEPSVPETRPARAGWCLFFPREAIPLFHPIPEELELWFGDDWIHHKLAQAGYRCEAILDCRAYHLGGRTLQFRRDKNQVIERDRERYFELTGERL